MVIMIIILKLKVINRSRRIKSVIKMTVKRGTQDNNYP